LANRSYGLSLRIGLAVPALAKYGSGGRLADQTDDLVITEFRDYHDMSRVLAGVAGVFIDGWGHHKI